MSRVHALGGILGAQLRAVIDAETENAQAIADYITSVGFEKGEGNSLGRFRMVSFTMSRRNNFGEMVDHQIEIPLLSILPIPMLSIEKADFEFDLAIHDIETITEKSSPNAVGSSAAAISNIGARPVIKPVQAKSLQARFAKTRAGSHVAPSTVTGSPSRRNERTTDGNLSVKVSVVQTDFPLGVEKLLGLAELGINDKSEG